MNINSQVASRKPFETKRAEVWAGDGGSLDEVLLVQKQIYGFFGFRV